VYTVLLAYISFYICTAWSTVYTGCCSGASWPSTGLLMATKPCCNTVDGHEALLQHPVNTVLRLLTAFAWFIWCYTCSMCSTWPRPEPRVRELRISSITSHPSETSFNSPFCLSTTISPRNPGFLRRRSRNSIDNLQSRLSRIPTIHSWFIITISRQSHVVSAEFNQFFIRIYILSRLLTQSYTFTISHNSIRITNQSDSQFIWSWRLTRNTIIANRSLSLNYYRSNPKHSKSLNV
jgi:hypothetical protein